MFTLTSLHLLSAVLLLSSIAKGRSGFFDRVEQRGSELDRTGIDGSPVHKHLEDRTEKRYRDAKNLWAEDGLSVSSFTPVLPDSSFCAC